MSKHPDLNEAMSIIQECLLKLTTTDNLYSVKLEDIDEDKQQGFKQVYEAYAQVPPREMKSVRFSDMRSKIKLSSSGRTSQSRRIGTLATMMYIPTTETVEEIKRAGTTLSFDPPPCELFDQLYGRVGYEWEFDMLEFSKKTPNVLIEVGNSLLLHALPYLEVESATLSNLLYSMQQLYFANPYHNAAHAACVAHCTRTLARRLSADECDNFTTVDEVTLVVAALGHDIAHPGRNNGYFINAYHPLAIVYNDASVLENFHSMVTFDLIGRPANNIFSGLMPDSFRLCRSRIIELILATDMKNHFEGMSRFRVRSNASDFNHRENSDDLCSS